MTACTDGKIKSSFDNPFPKRTKNLLWTLGSEFSLKQANDTNYYKVSFDKEKRENFIINSTTNDTIFAGTVCKYKGLFYFNQQLNDTTYWIYAVEIKDGTIRGLQTEYLQMLAWDIKFGELLENPQKINAYSSAVLKYVDTNINIIRLTPNKKEFQKFYSSIIDSLDVDTFVDWAETTSNQNVKQTIDLSDIEESDKSDYKIISKLYPNPANEVVTLSLNEEGVFEYGIYDINGRLLLRGQLQNQSNNIDISELKMGSYYIRVFSTNNTIDEIIKLIIN